MARGMAGEWRTRDELDRRGQELKERHDKMKGLQIVECGIHHTAPSRD